MGADLCCPRPQFAHPTCCLPHQRPLMTALQPPPQTPCLQARVAAQHHARRCTPGAPPRPALPRLQARWMPPQARALSAAAWCGCCGAARARTKPTLAPPTAAASCWRGPMQSRATRCVCVGGGVCGMVWWWWWCAWFVCVRVRVSVGGVGGGRGAGGVWGAARGAGRCQRGAEARDWLGGCHGASRMRRSLLRPVSSVHRRLPARQWADKKLWHASEAWAWCGKMECALAAIIISLWSLIN